MKALRLLLAAVLLGTPLAGVTQHALEVISLRHSTAEQVLPALRPLLEPGATMTGQYTQIIVRTSPRNLDEIRQALAAIDRPRRMLQISVRFDDVEAQSSRSLEAGGRISNRGSEVEIRADERQRSGESRIGQRVQVLEGARAVILLGESRPLMVRERIQTPLGPVGGDRIVVREAASGFEVVPRVTGSRVQLEIAPQRERFSGGPGTLDTQRVATTAIASLGEWLEIGGAVEHAMSSSGGLASGSRSQGSASRRIWVRVDEAGK